MKLSKYHMDHESDTESSSDGPGIWNGDVAVVAMLHVKEIPGTSTDFDLAKHQVSK